MSNAELEGTQVIITLQRQWTTSLFSLILLFLSVFVHAGGEYITYLHPDIQGSPLVATNDQGLVIWQESYAPWGQREIKDTASAYPALGSSIWYTGQEEEQALGLYYYGARWYSPDIAQFYSIDPAPVTVDNPRSFGRYLYGNNNPIRYTDPDGRTAVDIVNKRGRGIFLEGGCCAVPRGGAITSIGPRYYGNEGGGILGGRATSSSTAAGGANATGASRAPDFVVSPGGTAFPVPQGATGPTPVHNPAGNQTGAAFTGGAGGANGQVSTMRIMNPTPAKGNSPSYPKGYIKYENSASPRPQGVDPYSGKTLPNSKSHFPID